MHFLSPVPTVLPCCANLEKKKFQRGEFRQNKLERNLGNGMCGGSHSEAELLPLNQFLFLRTFPFSVSEPHTP